MKRSSTIGFYAPDIPRRDTSRGSYQRLVIEAMAEASPRRGYFRVYHADTLYDSDSDPLLTRHNVEAMLPDGGVWRRMARLWRTLRAAVDMERGDVDLYHSLTATLPFGLERRGIRSVVTVDNLDFLYKRLSPNPLKSAFRRVMLASSLKRADRIIALSEALKRDLTEKMGVDSDKVDVIYGGASLCFCRPLDPTLLADVRGRYALPDRYLLMVGEATERVKIATAVEALAVMDEDVSLVVVGRQTPLLERMKRRARHLGVEDRLLVIDRVERNDMPYIYASSEALLELSLYAGFSSRIVEALTVGTPVIAVRGTSHEEVGGKGAIYIDAEDSEALARTVDSLLEDKALRDSLRAEGKEYAARFRREVLAYNIANCYRRIGVEMEE